MKPIREGFFDSTILSSLLIAAPCTDRQNPTIPHAKHQSLQNGLRPRLLALPGQSRKKGAHQAGTRYRLQWLTGYDDRALQRILTGNTDFEIFFAEAPQLNPNASKITGLICGYRVEEIEDKLMQQIRYLNKLVDELAKGNSLNKVLRQ